MRKTWPLAMAVLFGVLGLLAASCAGSTPGIACGEGTHEAGGQCIPDASLTCGPGTHASAGQCVLDTAPVTCAAGTHLAGGACLPDAVVSCGAGTHRDGTRCVLDAAPLTCGAGTHVEATQCLPDVTCGPGTHEATGLCLPDATLSCGPGTHADAGQCALDVTPVGCGAGTHPLGGTCLPNSVLSCGPGTHVVGTVCVPDTAPLTCGPGTRAVAGLCFPDVACGPGTHADGAQCVPDSTLTCGPGTHVDAGQCVLDAAPVTCGAGTHLSNGACVPDSVLTCGPGTHAEGASCLSDPPLTCGAGTRLDGTACVSLGGYYDLRVDDTVAWANGYFRYRLLAIGRRQDGGPADDEVRVVSERPGAGTFSVGQFALGVSGTELWFVPCSTAEPGCTGPTRFHLVRAADPGVVLASTPVVDVRAPAPVGSAAACQGIGNVLDFQGSKALYGAHWTFQTGTWSSQAGDPALVRLDMRLDNPPFGARDGYLVFTSRELGLTLRDQVYDDAYRYPFEPFGHPGFEFMWDGGICNDSWSRFELQELSVVDGTLRRLTATFEQWCSADFFTSGCVHFEQ